MSLTAVIVSDAEDSRALCRLCMIYHEYFVNIFIPNDAFRICAEEAIHDLLSLKVAVGDGLPSNICHQCVNKLMEFRDFKEMCLKTAEELRKYDLDNVLRSHAKEEFGSSENALVLEKDVYDGEHCNEGDGPVNALTSVAVDPLAVDTMALKEEAQEPKGTAGDGNSLGDLSPHSHIQVTEVFVPVPDQLSIGIETHVKEDWRPAELMVNEEIGDGVDCIENGVPAVSLSSVNVDPLAVDTAALKEEAQEPNGDPNKGNSLDDPGPRNYIQVTEVFVPVPDQLAMGIGCQVEKYLRPTALMYKEEIGDGLDYIENDIPVESLSSVNVDPLAVDTAVDHQNNIGGMTEGPEKESDKFDADRKRTLQNKELDNPSSKPTYEENLQLKYLKPNSFVVDSFPERRVKQQKKNVKFHVPSKKFSQLNDRERPVRNQDCEQLGHQAENPSYPTEYICNYCNKRYSEIYSLALHIKIHVDGMRSASALPKKEISPRFSQNLLVKAFKCIECGKTFSRRSELNRHSIIHTDVKRFKCNECGKLFTRKDTLKTHSFIHTDVKRFKCNECGKSFTKSSDLKSHSVIHTGVKQFKCNECGKMFTKSSDLKNHLLVHNGVKQFKCNDCGKVFTWKCNLKRHSVIHTGVKRFKCKECGKMFSKSSDLKSHFLVHTGVKQFKCNECGKMFTKSGNLNSHLLVHTGVKQFKCNECGKMFAWKCNLELHSLIHTGVKRFKCKECGKIFTKSSDLKSHLLFHTGVKKFKCKECGKMFTKSSDLKSHLLVHTGVKQFKCNECGKTFSRKGNLNEHLVVHTGVKRFKCNECGKMFTKSSVLKSHSVVHTGVKAFKCYYCAELFKWRSSLNSHLLSHADRNP